MKQDAKHIRIRYNRRLHKLAGSLAYGYKPCPLWVTIRQDDTKNAATSALRAMFSALDRQVNHA